MISSFRLFIYFDNFSLYCISFNFHSPDTILISTTNILSLSSEIKKSSTRKRWKTPMKFFKGICYCILFKKFSCISSWDGTSNLIYTNLLFHENTCLINQFWINHPDLCIMKKIHLFFFIKFHNIEHL